MRRHDQIDEIKGGIITTNLSYQCLILTKWTIKGSIILSNLSYQYLTLNKRTTTTFFIKHFFGMNLIIHSVTGIVCASHPITSQLLHFTLIFDSITNNFLLYNNFIIHIYIQNNNKFLTPNFVPSFSSWGGKEKGHRFILWMIKYAISLSFSHKQQF